jgi:tetratricopeptide (TPR) repeat protein
MVAALSVASLALADTLVVGGNARTGAKIKSYRNGVFDYTLDGREVNPVAGDRVSQIALDDDPVLTAAEQALVGEKWAAAVDEYQRALKATKRVWLKDWVLPRMVVAAERAGKFDVAVSGFVQMLKGDAGVAMKYRPWPAETTAAAALTAAAGELAKASSLAAWSTTQKQAILSLLMDVERVQGDVAGATKLSEQLLRSAVVNKADPASERVVADIYIGSARLAVLKKEYARATALIEQNGPLFTDRVQQVEALYCLALARDGELGAEASKDALKDLAIAYMRVVAAGRGGADRRDVPEALLRVGELQEQLGDKRVAQTLYAEVTGEYKDSPAAARADSASSTAAARSACIALAAAPTPGSTARSAAATVSASVVTLTLAPRRSKAIATERTLPAP